MDQTGHRVEKIQNTKELADSRFHILERHPLSRNVSQQLGRIYSKRFMDKADVAAVGAIHNKVANQLPNELPARMVCFQSVNVVVDVQFMLPCLAQCVNFQDGICGFTRSLKLRMTDLGTQTQNLHQVAGKPNSRRNSVT